LVQVNNAPVRAAGGVLWRKAASGKDAVEVAIIHRPRYDDWSLPKGKLNPGEIEIEGAVREIAEETGYRVTVGRPLGEVRYSKDGRPKIVRYWAMRAEGGLFIPSREVDELRWLSIPEAAALLSRPRDRELLEAFASTPPSTAAVLLVRHASAGSRSANNGKKDDDRPLDELGWTQAEALVWLLTRFDVREIISAPITRCLQTVEPLSKAVGLSIRQEPLLAEEHYWGREKEVVNFVRSAGTPGMGTVLCSQGGLIPDVLERISANDGLTLPEDAAYKKGSTWSLTFAGKKLFAAEYFPPLT
jgi:8-oxo-dGTP diphosphatase